MHRIALTDGGVDLGFVRFHRGHGRIRFLRDDAVVGGHVPIVERLGVEPVVQRPAHAEVLHRLRKRSMFLMPSGALASPSLISSAAQRPSRSSMTTSTSSPSESP